MQNYILRCVKNRCFGRATRKQQQQQHVDNSSIISNNSNRGSVGWHGLGRTPLYEPPASFSFSARGFAAPYFRICSESFAVFRCTSATSKDLICCAAAAAPAAAPPPAAPLPVTFTPPSAARMQIAAAETARVLGVPVHQTCCQSHGSPKESELLLAAGLANKMVTPVVVYAAACCYFLFSLGGGNKDATMVLRWHHNFAHRGGQVDSVAASCCCCCFEDDDGRIVERRGGGGGGGGGGGCCGETMATRLVDGCFKRETNCLCSTAAAAGGAFDACCCCRP